MYEHDMRGEGESILIEEGWNTHLITNIIPAKSKAGNDMFIITLEHPDSGSVDEVYAITTKGKRWILKQLLAACGIQEGKDGIYHWCEEDVIGCSVEANNKPEPNEFTRRDGTVVKEMRNKINGFRASKGKATV